jgi:hypothetical protein
MSRRTLGTSALGTSTMVSPRCAYAASSSATASCSFWLS